MSSKAVRAIFLVFSLVLLASLIYNYQYVRIINRGYNNVLVKESSEFQAFENITFDASSIQRALLNIAIVAPDEYSPWQKKIEQSQSRIDEQFNNLQQLSGSQEETASINKLKGFYANYKIEYSRLLGLLLAENFKGTLQDEKIKELGATYESYMKQQENQLAFFRQNAEAESSKLRANSDKTSAILLLVGTLPYTLLACALIISFIVLILLGRTTRWFSQQEHY